MLQGLAQHKNFVSTIMQVNAGGGTRDVQRSRHVCGCIAAAGACMVGDMANTHWLSPLTCPPTLHTGLHPPGNCAYFVEPDRVSGCGC